MHKVDELGAVKGNAKGREDKVAYGETIEH
jgi:hypothetical protein